MEKYKDVETSIQDDDEDESLLVSTSVSEVVESLKIKTELECGLRHCMKPRTEL